MSYSDEGIIDGDEKRIIRTSGSIAGAPGPNYAKRTKYRRCTPLTRSKLLIATRNPGKMREYRQLLRDVPYQLVSLDDLGITKEVEETGESKSA